MILNIFSYICFPYISYVFLIFVSYIHFISFFENCLLRSASPFSTGLVVFLLLDFKVADIFWIVFLCQISSSEIFFPTVSSMFLHTGNSFLYSEKANFAIIPFAYFFFCYLCSTGLIQLIFPYTNVSPMLSSSHYIVPDIKFSPFLHLELVFAYSKKVGI